MNWLRDIRLSKNFTQSQVASSAGLSVSFYCQIENKSRSPSVDTAKRIAKTLGFDWTRFFEAI